MSLYLMEGMWRSSPHTWAWWEPFWLWRHLQKPAPAACPLFSCRCAGPASPSAQQSDRSRGPCGSPGQGSSQFWPSLDGSGWSPRRREESVQRTSGSLSYIIYCNIIFICIELTWASKLLTSDGGSCWALPATSPRRRFLTATFLMLKPTLWPGRAVCRPLWCISIDLTSAVSLAGENMRVMPGLRTPVSILPTGTVPTPEKHQQ